MFNAQSLRKNTWKKKYIIRLLMPETNFEKIIDMYRELQIFFQKFDSVAYFKTCLCYCSRFSENRRLVKRRDDIVASFKLVHEFIKMKDQWHFGKVMFPLKDYQQFMELCSLPLLNSLLSKQLDTRVCFHYSF